MISLMICGCDVTPPRGVYSIILACKRTHRRPASIDRSMYFDRRCHIEFRRFHLNNSTKLCQQVLVFTDMIWSACILVARELLLYILDHVS